MRFWPRKQQESLRLEFGAGSVLLIKYPLHDHDARIEAGILKNQLENWHNRSPLGEGRDAPRIATIPSCLEIQVLHGFMPQSAFDF